MGCARNMTTDKHHDASADMDEVSRGGASKQDPQPANEALPDGQFDDQRMPTTDGEPAADDAAASAGAESQEEGDEAMDAAQEATEN